MLQEKSAAYGPVTSAPAFFNNDVVLPANDYKYDAIYRLVQAKGREHASIGDTQVDENDCPLQNLPHTNDASAVRNYTESYLYDRVGNILELFHDAEGTPHATWRRHYDYGPFTDDVPDTNRLRSTSLAGDTPGLVPYSAEYTHDNHGNMTSMPHLAEIDWTPFDQMQRAQVSEDATIYFAYDSSGTRVRKVFDTGMNLIKERIYLGGYEIYREIVSSAVDLERQTLHVLDGAKRIAMVETKTIDGGSPVGTPTEMKRFQLGNHLGSAMLELDETGLVISYEEFLPYGVSAYRSARSGVQVSARRYRYVGLERDDETGLYLMGARYYAAWLGRWTSADPMGIGADGPGVYNYTRGSPVTMLDPDGTEGIDCQSIQRDPAKVDLRALPRQQTKKEAETVQPSAAQLNRLDLASSTSGGKSVAPNAKAPAIKSEGTAPAKRIGGTVAPNGTSTSYRERDFSDIEAYEKYVRDSGLSASDVRNPNVGILGLGGEPMTEDDAVIRGYHLQHPRTASASEFLGAILQYFGPSVSGTGALAKGASVASSGGEMAPATTVRTITHGEKISDLLEELATRTYEAGGAEHAIITTKSGERLIVSGGPGGITSFPEDLRRVIVHTHPRPTGPSALDFDMLEQTKQRSSWIYELFSADEPLTRFRRK